MPKATRFREVADRPGMTRTALAVWMQTSHPTMPNIIVEKNDMLNVIAYILSLKDRDRDWSLALREGANVKLVRILLPINQYGTTKACAAAAFSLAERSGALLEALHPCPAPSERLPYSTELSPFYFEELIDVGKKQVALEKRLARKWLGKTARAHPKAHAELVSIEGLVAPAVAMRAKVADLAVLPSIDAEEDGFWAGARDAALFHSGRPLLVVPKGAEGAVGETVVIAWKDAAEAVRAVAAAQPFLAKAKGVRLVSVTERGQDVRPLTRTSGANARVTRSAGNG